MKPQNDRERLLADVLGESSEPEFHAAMLAETLRLARGRRRLRQVQRAGGLLAVSIVLAMLMMRSPRPATPVKEASPPRAYELTISQPLSLDQVVTTIPTAADLLLASTTTIPTVSTEPGNYRLLGDDELLALAPQPAALVRRGPHRAELVLVSPVRAAEVHPN